MFNNITLCGYLGNDPEVRVLQSGVKVAVMSLATSESWKDDKGEWQSETQWHNVILWRERADAAENRYKKGHRVLVEGKVKYRKNTDKDGNVRYYTDIVADKVLLLEKLATGRMPTAEDEPQRVSKPTEDIAEPTGTDGLPF